jgi:hypothetical protein
MVDVSERIYLRLASYNLINCPTKFDESLMVTGLNSMLQRLDASEAVADSSWMFRYLNAINFAFQTDLCNLSQTLDTHWKPIDRDDENSTAVAAIDVFYNFVAFRSRLRIINQKATSSHLHAPKIYFKSDEIFFPRLTSSSFIKTISVTKIYFLDDAIPRLIILVDKNLAEILARFETWTTLSSISAELIHRFDRRKGVRCFCRTDSEGTGRKSLVCVLQAFNIFDATNHGGQR